MLHVTCKHCGQPAEVADLLAAAEQPCQHCGKPLLDDKPTPSTRPTAVPRLDMLPHWFHGNRIAIRRADAMKKPPGVCIQCGAAAVHVVQESYQPAYSSGIASQSFKLLVPYCDKHYRKYLRWLTIMWLMLLLALVPGVLWWLRPNYLQELGLTLDPSQVFSTCITASMLLVLVYSQMGGVRFVAYDQEYIEARGVSKEYIRAMRESEARRLDDVP